MKKNIFFSTLFILLSILMIKYYKITVLSSMESIKTWINIIFPSMFPLLIITDFMINYNTILLINSIFKNFYVKIIHLPEYLLFIQIIVFFSGSIVGIKIIKDLLDKEKITIEQANYLVKTCHSFNPIFILSISNCILNKGQYTILLSIIISSIILCYVYRPKNIYSYNYYSSKSQESFMNCLSNSILKTMNILFIVLGSTLLLSIITSILHNIFNYNDIINTIITGFLESTKGINMIKYLNISNIYKSVMIVTFLSFGGLSIHLQIMSILNNYKIKYKEYLISRIVHSLISIFLVLVFMTLEL